MDRLVHGIAADGRIRVLAAITTDAVAEAVRRHDPSPTVAAALGRVLTGSLLLAATFKEFDRLTVKLECRGPVGGITAEAMPDGSVRGYVKEPRVEIPANVDGKFDVKGIVGEGNFFVIREAGAEIGMRLEPYVGSVPIVSGEIAEDFAYYLAKSEQLPSAVSLGVLLRNEAPFVAAAGGLMIQVLPGANENIVTMIEDTMSRAPHLTSAIRPETDPAALIRVALGEVGFEILGEMEPEFRCTCSPEKASAMIEALGSDEINAMIREQDGAVINCGFCNEVYRFTASELTSMSSGSIG